MGNLLLISNLNSNPLAELETALESIETTIENIILHYAYQVPHNAENVIEKNDEMKMEANNKLNKDAAEITKKTGIETTVKVSLGSEKSTLKRLLSNHKFDYVLTFDGKVDRLLKLDFPNVQFINN